MPSVAPFGRPNSPARPPYSSAVNVFSRTFSPLGLWISTVNAWPAKSDMSGWSYLAWRDPELELDRLLGPIDRPVGDGEDLGLRCIPGRRRWPYQTLVKPR